MSPLLSKSHRPWIGFTVGLLAIVVPMGIVLLLRGGGGRPAATGGGGRPVASPIAGAPPAGSTAAESRRGTDAPDPPFPIKDRFDEASGAAVVDPVGPIDRALLRASLRKAEEWLRASPTAPYTSRDLSSLRTFALEMECWHRLWESESDGDRKARLGREVVEKLRSFARPEELADRIRVQASMDGIYEVTLLAGRCMDHGVDIAPVVAMLRQLLPSVERSIRSLPPSTAALFTAEFERIGLPLQTPLASYRAQGMLASRPREAVTGASAMIGLTQEIWAYTGGGRTPIPDLSPAERAWLGRALPHFALAASLLDLRDLSGDLLSCLRLCGLQDAYGYREGIRILLERQNADGSFGGAGGAPGGATTENRAARLAPTSTCVTALSLELHPPGAGS